MKQAARKYLKPIFKAISKHGLGNPHTPYEAELLCAGVKPVAIMSPNDIDAKMQAHIDSGAIVKVGEKSFEKTYRIYHTPKVKDSAAQVSGILKSFFKTRVQPDANDVSLVIDFYNLPKDGKKAEDWAQILHAKISAFQMALYETKTTPNMIAVLKGSIPALEPIRVDEGMPISDELEQSVERGDLNASDFQIEELVQVYAQSNKVAEGKELYARYYGVGEENYPPLHGLNSHKRIAQLLGFTDNDFAWFAGAKYQNPLIKSVLLRTEDIRKWARKQYLLSDAPNELRNE
ncbi:hypothetical protein BXY85_1653 [Roseivirga pacifica]|uniref:Uncharacterized protein n=1 Tax=Roseivirga pacifica TaxID=1267423 RepID=A0A1I0MS58_9BACT|nr:hypothetical protein [Roseivirga pacifica]MCO6359176.1 hypothetical protein [Roseivirga pacifica]MCO6365188.1 hypothetical protein [Roseivirga pacifica]MCO6372082.1 hypothetical protein [Roseivirga pacifica]MCO6375807.1 hypothetical protein [Roseivirga pacifica]MCO6379460.1 hypothetical protein [Roseivirga pacifica]